jgi:hypothetical protein
MRANVGRFVFSRDNAGSENFQHVLRNDGEGVQLRGVLDAAGNVVTLAELAELSEGEGNGLETMTGRLFIKDGTLVFQPKSGAGAGDTEIVTYVGEDAEGNAYTRNVEIRFTDKADEFISDDAVDTYYVCTHNGAAYHVTNDADLRLGAGSDLVIMEGFQVGKSKWTINVGSGDNAVALKSATSMANSSSTMNVNSGTGNDTIAIEASAEYVAVNASTVSVNAGAGDDSVSVTSGYIMTRSESTMMNIQAGAGNDTIALDASRSVAFEGSQVVVDAGVGDDDISVNSDRHTADFNASMTVLAGDGNDTIALVTAQSAAYGRSTVTVDAGGGVDDISVTSVGHIADSRASMTVLAGDGNDAIALETAQSVASGQSTVTVAGGEGDDSVSVKSLGDYMASGKSSVDVDAGDGNDTIALETTGDMADGTSTVTVNGGIGNDLIEMRGGHSNGGVLLTGGDGADIFSFGGAELPGNTISGSFVITDFNAGEGDRLQLKNLLPPEAEENLDQYLSIVRSDSNNEDLLLTINKSSVAATNLEVRLEGVLADGGSMNGMDDTAINELITSHTIIQNSGG